MITIEWDHEPEELSPKAAQQWEQACNEMRSEATQKALTLILRIIQHETRKECPFPRIRDHLLSACEELQAAIDLYYSHNLKGKQQ